jgi:hypothetical protein
MSDVAELTRRMAANLVDTCSSRLWGGSVGVECSKRFVDQTHLAACIGSAGARELCEAQCVYVHDTASRDRKPSTATRLLMHFSLSASLQSSKIKPLPIFRNEVTPTRNAN